MDQQVQHLNFYFDYESKHTTTEIAENMDMLTSLDNISFANENNEDGAENDSLQMQQSHLITSETQNKLLTVDILEWQDRSDNNCRHHEIDAKFCDQVPPFSNEDTNQVQEETVMGIISPKFGKECTSYNSIANMEIEEDDT